MALGRDEITWLEPGFEIPQRSAEEDAKVWGVWADMTGTEWAKDNRFPLAVIATMHGTSAFFMVERLYEIHGDGIRYGLIQER
jgi:hypothetical protein